jgi:hypothetical protein
MQPRIALTSLAPSIALAIGAILMASQYASSQTPPTYTVCDAGCDYLTIADAVAVLGVPDATFVLQLSAESYSADSVVIPDGRTVTIRGLSSDRTGAVVGGPNHGFDVSVGGSLTLRDLTLDGAGRTQGGIRSDGTLLLENVVARDHVNNSGGGAISVRGGSVTIRSSLFAGNHSDHMGGAVYAAPDHGSISSTLIEDTTFDGNDTTGDGGALYLPGDADTKRVERSLFVTTSDTVFTELGEIRHSSFPAGDTMVVSINVSAVDAAENWWGHETGPTNEGGSGSTVTGPVEVTPFLESVAVSPSSGSLTTGQSVTLTSTLTTNTGATVHGPFVTFEVTGANPQTQSRTTGTHSYTGSNAGTDTVTAGVVFGDRTSGSVGLAASTTVTWTAPTPPPPADDPPEPDPPPGPPSEFVRSAEDVMRSMGLLPPTPVPLQEHLTRRDVATVLTRLFLSRARSSLQPVGSSVAEGTWFRGMVEEARSRQAGVVPPSDSQVATLNVDQLLLLVSKSVGADDVQALAQQMRLVTGNSFPGEFAPDEQGFLYDVYDASFGFLFDNTGTLTNTMSQGMPKAVERAGGIAAISAEGHGASPVVIEVAAEDVPAGVRPEQFTLVRFELEAATWHRVETFVQRLEDGGVGIVAWPDRSGLYNILIQPVAERVLHDGVTAIVWHGADGQAPGRALLGLDAEVRALWAQDADGRWRLHGPGLPDFANTLRALRDGTVLTVVSSGGTWVLPDR